MALMIRAKGGAIDWFYDLIENGMLRQSGRHNHMVTVAIDAAARTVGRPAAAVAPG